MPTPRPRKQGADAVALRVGTASATASADEDAQTTAERYGRALAEKNPTYRDLVDVMEYPPFRRLFRSKLAAGDRLDEQTLVMFMKTYEAAKQTLPSATPNQLVAVVDGLIRRPDTRALIAAGAAANANAGDGRAVGQTPDDVAGVLANVLVSTATLLAADGGRRRGEEPN